MSLQSMPLRGSKMDKIGIDKCLIRLIEGLREDFEVISVMSSEVGYICL